MPENSQFRSADAVQVRGVLGLAAAADLAFLHERKVCGHVIDGLMGGSPADFPDRYAAGSPVNLVPLGLPQILVNGTRDPFWSSIAQRYLDAAEAVADTVQLTVALESGRIPPIEDPHQVDSPDARQVLR